MTSRLPARRRVGLHAGRHRRHAGERVRRRLRLRAARRPRTSSASRSCAGPQSALFGSDAIGGVVQIVTRHERRRSAASASIEGGSFGDDARRSRRRRARAATGPGEAAVERLASDGFNGAAHRGRRDDRATTTTIALGDAGSGGLARRAGGAIRGERALRARRARLPGTVRHRIPSASSRGIDRVSRGTDDRWLPSLGGDAARRAARARARRRSRMDAIDGTYHEPVVRQPRGSADRQRVASRRWNARVQSDVVGRRPRIDLSAGVEFQGERARSTYITGAASEMSRSNASVAGYFARSALARWHDRLFVTGGVRVDDIHRDALEGDPQRRSPRGPRSPPTTSSRRTRRSRPPGSCARRRAASTEAARRRRHRHPSAGRVRDRVHRQPVAEAGAQPQRRSGRRPGVRRRARPRRGDRVPQRYDDLIVAVGSFVEASRYRTDNIANARARGLELAGTARARIATATPVDLEWRVAYTFLDTRDARRRSSAAMRRRRSPSAIRCCAGRDTRRPRTLTATRGRADRRTSRAAAAAACSTSSRTTARSAGCSTRRATRPGAPARRGASLRSAEIFGRIDNLFDRAYEEVLGFPAPGRGAFVGVRIAAGR